MCEPFGLYDAAFLVAVHLFPEKFTPAEMRAGIDLVLCHIPAHVIAGIVSRTNPHPCPL